MGEIFWPGLSQHCLRVRLGTALSPRQGCWPSPVWRSMSPRAKGIDSSPPLEATQDSPTHLGHHVQFSRDGALPLTSGSSVLRRRSRRRRPWQRPATRPPGSRDRSSAGDASPQLRLWASSAPRRSSARDRNGSEFANLTIRQSIQDPPVHPGGKGVHDGRA